MTPGSNPGAPTIMKKLGLIILLFLVITIGIYLNLSYTHIYNTIGQAALKSSDQKGTYLLGYGINPENIVYVAMGDSLTSGVGVSSYEQSFPFLIAKKISSGGNDVILKNASFPGLRVKDLNGKILEQTINQKPNIITILVGVNDIHGNIKKDEFRKSYEEILERLTKETKSQIYIISIPFIGSPELLLFPYNYYFDWKTKEFNEVLKELSNKYNIKYIDIYSETSAEYKKVGDHYSSDFFHPSEKGYLEWANIIYANINK